MAEPTSFLLPFFSSSRNLFILRNFNCHHSHWNLRGTSDPCREKVFDWVISSDLLPSMILTHQPFYTIFPLLPPLLLLPAPGRCFRTWVLTTYQLFYLSLSLRSITPTSVPLPSTFRELVRMTLPPTLTSTVLMQRYTRLSHFFLCCCSLYLSGTECGQIFHSFWPHQTPS